MNIKLEEKMDEDWKNIDNLGKENEGFYMISNLGNVKSIKTNKYPKGI